MAATNETNHYRAFRAEIQEGLSEEEATTYVAAAARLYQDDDVDVDDNAAVQPVPDHHGAYVMAWVWVDDEDVVAFGGRGT